MTAATRDVSDDARSEPDEDTRAAVGRIAEALLARSLTLAVAESLTGGLLTNVFAAGPDASKWLKGGLVAYHSEVKRELLRVSDGPVSALAALEMALGARRLFHADVTISLTGAGGPHGQDGKESGAVRLAVLSPRGEHTSRQQFDGDPIAGCRQSCASAVRMVEVELARGRSEGRAAAMFQRKGRPTNPANTVMPIIIQAT